ncbi:MAG: carboxylating nicotinate-nucleotide diphosphorylase [Planctomycetota bacterium]
MIAEFTPVEWDDRLVADCRELVRLALREDLIDPSTEEPLDATSVAVVDPSARGEAAIVSRGEGVLAGAGIAPIVLDMAGADAEWFAAQRDGAALTPGSVVGTLRGSARDLLRCERTVLNLMGRLCGIATLTSRFVAAVADHAAAVYDTRKTTPGWRRLEKFAVRQGGGRNHRTGLFDAVLIKDNHLALADRCDRTPGDAVRIARERFPNRIVEVEVDTLDQLREALPARPDIVLLDNMTNALLREAVAIRDAVNPGVVLEASGGVRVDTIAGIAATGVERISVGALTHAAIGLDLGLDWRRP